MTGTILQLRSHEVWQTLEALDPVATMAEHLISRTFDRTGHGRRSPGRLISWNGPGAGGADFVLLDHPDATGPCVVPAQSLRGAQAAALAAVAAREMLVSGGVTMAVLGPVGDTQPQLSLVARHVPDISHVALCGATMGTYEVAPQLVDQLDLSGIELSVVSTVAQAVFGANLVIAIGHTASAQSLAGLRIGHLAHGALLVNATGEDLPTDLVDQVDQVYVDDLGLLDRYPDRRVVACHLAEHLGQHTVTPGRGAEPRIAGDLVQLLTGRQSGRRRTGEIALVELLGVHELNADLAYRIYEVASHTGLGVRIAN
jgi:ornithine cyclodeaminase/alanine dehydrogenase-like protein (mu-crystallin family)